MALPVANPTYFLAPNWTFRPDGPIALGNIIADPLKPHIVLTKPNPAAELPEVTTVSESDVTITDGGSQKLSFSLWTSFLEFTKLKLGAQHSSSSSTTYSIETLDTKYFRDGVTKELVTERTKDPIITEMMKPESFLSKPVYLITGIKIAKGFRISSTSTSKCGGDLGATLPSGGPLSAGGEGGFGTDKTRAYGLNSDNVVFAYQLLKMAPKGWGKNRGVHGTEYQSTAVFLGDDGGDEGDILLDVEFGYFECADFNDYGVKPDDVVDEKKVPAADGKEEYSVISLKKDHTVASKQDEALSANKENPSSSGGK